MSRTNKRSRDQNDDQNDDTIDDTNDSGVIDLSNLPSPDLRPPECIDLTHSPTTSVSSTTSQSSRKLSRKSRSPPRSSKKLSKKSRSPPRSSRKLSRKSRSPADPPHSPADPPRSPVDSPHSPADSPHSSAVLVRKSPRVPEVNSQYQKLIKRIQDDNCIRTIGHPDVKKELKNTNLSLEKKVNVTSINAFLAELPNHPNIVLLSMQNLFVNADQNEHSNQVINQLIDILPMTSIIKLNLGEYFPSIEVIENFITMLPNTLVGFIYFSEHAIDTEQKGRIKNIIRMNREKEKFYEVYYNNYKYVSSYKKSYWDDPNGVVYERAQSRYQPH
jgi:hypothetical protein